MRNLRRIAAPVAALALSAAAVTGMTLTAPVALASDLTPAQVAGDTPRATVTEGPRDVEAGTAYDGNTSLIWRDKISEYDNSRVVEMWAHSPSMNRDIPLVVIKADPTAGPRPVIYLLNGGDGGEGRANWIMQTDVIDYYLTKNVNVVIPMQGKFSYYTDWVEDVPALGGKQTWETFLTKELPGPLETKLGATNRRAIAGMSMSATSSLLLAQHNPGFYDAVGSFSGCAETSRGLAPEYIRLTLNRGGATPEQMWGPLGTPNWHYNDALINADKLRGTEVYVSNASGYAGTEDLWTSPWTGGEPLNVFIHVVNGGIIEGATNMCTHDLKVKMDSQGVPGNFNFRPTGTHSWGYWQQDLRDSWPVFARAFGLDE
ncbi:MULTISPECIES: alpha/beta hydrolase [unclassified Corynebacterium]|uniref:alpha/beta hydrolase n=1 Tax=unclassified Corynebacterium TaxID=2624378 RepID=UPI0035237597